MVFFIIIRLLDIMIWDIMVIIIGNNLKVICVNVKFLIVYVLFVGRIIMIFRNICKKKILRNKEICIVVFKNIFDCENNIRCKKIKF